MGPRHTWSNLLTWGSLGPDPVLPSHTGTSPSPSFLYTCSSYMYWQEGDWTSTERPSCGVAYLVFVGKVEVAPLLLLVLRAGLACSPADLSRHRVTVIRLQAPTQRGLVCTDARNSMFLRNKVRNIKISQRIIVNCFP